MFILRTNKSVLYPVSYPYPYSEMSFMLNRYYDTMSMAKRLNPDAMHRNLVKANRINVAKKVALAGGLLGGLGGVLGAVLGSGKKQKGGCASTGKKDKQKRGRIQRGGFFGMHFKKGFSQKKAWKDAWNRARGFI